MSNNTSDDRAIELKVGVFVLIGLVFVALMSFKFGRVGQGLFQSYYPLTILFPNASGLIKNSDVQLAGARIGYVSEKPAISPSGAAVTIRLAIQSTIAIPRKSNFVVSASGLLGDKFVEVKPAPDFDPAHFDRNDPHQVFTSGETIEGATDNSGLEGLEKQGGQVFEELKVEIQKLTQVTDKINNGVLSETNQQNISQTFANLKSTSERFNVAAKDLGGVVQDAKGAVDTANKTMVTANAAATDLRGTLADAQKALDAVKTLIAKAQTGNGVVATLLNDRQISDNLRAFAANLRQRGILFYKNTPSAAATPAAGSRSARALENHSP